MYASQEFLAGFHELIPLDLIPMFSPAELELLMYPPGCNDSIMHLAVARCRFVN
jgi:hypothetical protein